MSWDMNEIKYCKSCYNEIKQGWIYCPYCKNKLKIDVINNDFEDSEKEEKKKDKKEIANKVSHIIDGLLLYCKILFNPIGAIIVIGFILLLVALKLFIVFLIQLIIILLIISFFKVKDENNAESKDKYIFFIIAICIMAIIFSFILCLSNNFYFFGS